MMKTILVLTLALVTASVCIAQPPGYHGGVASEAPLEGGSMMPGGSMTGTPSTSAEGSTQCQQEVLRGIGIGFFMGKMAALASQGFNITGYNAEVDRFNAWIQQKYGNDPSLLMPKMQETDAGMAGSIPVTPNN